MKQILHIFAKDARHFWPEILVSLATLGVLMYSAHHLLTSQLLVSSLDNWRNQQASDRRWTGMLSALVPIAWWLLIARLVYAESPVGDRQFWITRPYNLGSLLAAKLLFLAIFLYFPLVVVQSVLLISAGSNPLDCISGMIFNLIFVTALLVLPVIAIATVTSNFLGMALAILGVVVGIGVVVPGLNDASALAGILSFRSLTMPVGDRLLLALLLMALCTIVIGLQYTLRKIWVSRIVLFAPPAALAIFCAITPNSLFAQRILNRSNDALWSSKAAIDRAYPPVAAGAAAPVQLAIHLDEHHQIHIQKTPSAVLFKFPLALSGMAEGTAANYDRLSVTFEGADGSRWGTTVPNMLHPNLILADNKERGAEFFMPLAEYDRFKSTSSTVTITLLLTELKVANVSRVPMRTQDLPVPHLGTCQAVGTNFICRTAFRPPQLTQITPEWSEAPCVARQADFEKSGWVTTTGNFNTEPAEFGIVPVHVSWIDLEQGYKGPAGEYRLCSGNFVTFTQYRMAGHTQASLTIPNFQIPAQPDVKK
jgi:hypothetical protein